MKPNFLRDIRFTDLTWAGAGPFGTKIFSDFGAEVIKIESMTRPDSVRTGGPFKDGKAGINRSGYFASRNTGKKSVSIDLKSECGKEIVRDLIRSSDVLSNNFSPGAMERLGLGYEEVRKIKPDIIFLSMPMYGEDGPRASMLGVGMTISAITSLMWMTAYGPNKPIGPGTHYPDHAANPYHAAVAVMGALRYRQLTGRGMKIDLSQVESTINFVGPAVLEHTMAGKEPAQIGNRSRSAAPHNVFRCAGDDDWCAIAVETDDHWKSLLTVIERIDLASDSRLKNAAGRLAHLDIVETAVANWAKSRLSEDVASNLRAVGIPAAVVARSQYLVKDDPQLAARNYWQVLDHPEMGESLFNSPPYRIDGERIELTRPPLFGEHTEEVLSSVLQLGESSIADLQSMGVLK